MSQDMSPEDIKKQAKYLRGIGVGQFIIRAVVLLGALGGSCLLLKALINLVQQTDNIAAPQYALSILALEIAFLGLMFVITKLCQEE